MKQNTFPNIRRIAAAVMVLMLILAMLTVATAEVPGPEGFDYETMVPRYEGYPYVEINRNKPFFKKSDITKKCFEMYSELDDLGRCGPAFACVGIDIMPTSKRESIGSVKPTGWHTASYPEYINDKYLYNRCHLIAFMLAGENANPLNLITGTRYMNVTGMLPFEDEVNDYVQFTDNHVMYRVTPIFIGDELVARGVLMEATDVENNGNSVQFCVFCYNVQPYIAIDYKTGESRVDPEYDSYESEGWGNTNTQDPMGTEYVININSKVFHKPNCQAADKISKKNRKEWKGNREDLIADGYKPCKMCKP